MDFDRDANVDAAADHQQAPGSDVPAHAVRAKAASHHQPGATRTVAVQDGVVVLPAGTDINDIKVDGRNLIVTLPDGTQMVILDGAVLVPRLVVGDVEIPSVNLAALLIGEEPQPAAGPARSSGGNFLAAEGDVGDPHGLGDLLPPTELAFGQPEQREILPIGPDEKPEVEIVTPDQPAGATSATASVSESGLGARGAEPAGSAAASDSERTTGSIVFSANDGPAVVTINGAAVTQVGQTFTTPLGVLTITSIANGSIGYSYVLSDNVVGTPPAEVFTVVVTDASGDTASATLTISIADDVPQAINDVDSVTEDGALVADGNLLTGQGGSDANGTDGAADVQGADGATVTSLGTFPGSYGTLTISAGGGYRYELANDNAAIQFLVPGQTLTESFSYTITDADGDTSTATLTITINGADDGVTITGLTNGPGANGAELVVQENDLADGSSPDAAALTQGGSFSVTGPDGLASVTVGGVAVMVNGAFVAGQVVTTPLGTLTITGFTATAQQGGLATAGTFTYSFLLTDNSLGHSAAGADNVFQSFAVVATDRNGSTASGAIDVQIVDDLPVARNDEDRVAAGTYGPELGNVITGEGTVSGAAGADVKGADGAAVAGVVAGASQSALVDGTTVGAGIKGLYGTLTLNGDGSYDYVRHAGTPGGVSDSFTYTLRDSDGDLSTATLRIEIVNSDVMIISIPRVGEGTVVDEAGLDAGVGVAPGSNAAASVETTAGVITYSAPDGPATVTINGVLITQAGQTIQTSYGVLEIIAISEGRIEYSYTLTNNSSGEGVTDSFEVTVTDVDGDQAIDTLVITILDDVPTANADVDSVREDGPLVADGNVLTGANVTDANSTDGVADVQGADGATVTGIAFGGAAGLVGEPLPGSYGSLLIQPDGRYFYTLNNNNGVVQGLDSTQSLTETFTYTITDGDNDSSQATITITIEGADDGVTITGLGGAGAELIVREDDLPDGSSPEAAALTQTGSFTLSALDGVSTITVGGQSIFASGNFIAGVTIATGYGTLSIDSFTPVIGADGDVIGGTINYSYVLSDNTLLHSGANDGSLTDSFAVVVSDTDGSQASASLDVTVVDDVPQAVDDGGYAVTEDAPANTLSGNVLTNDVSGADAPKNFVAWSAADAATITELSKYGTLTQNADGSWSYALDNSRAATQALGAGFSQDFTLNYTMQDADGDQSSAKLVITVRGAADDATVTTLAATGPDNSVNEAGLPSGSLNDGSHVTTGTFTVTATDGIANIVVGGTTFTLAQMQAFGTTNGVVDTGEGTLRLTGYTAATGVVSYSYTLKATIDNDSKGGATPTAFDDLIVLTVNSVGGTTGSDDLIIRIIDDVPGAVDDAGGTVTEDGATGSVSGNVLTNDVSGADQPKSFVAWSAGDAAAIAALNMYGTLTQNADGSWSYVLDNSRAATQALGAAFNQSYTLNYTMQDADGDQSSAKLVITVRGAADSASVVTAVANGPDATVYEAGLPTGSANDNSDIATGSFTVSATDGIANIVVGGTTFTLAQMQAFGTTNGVVDTGEGTLRLTGYTAATGVVSYSYTLKATIDNDSKPGATLTSFDDSVSITVNGIGGTTGSDTLIIRIIDDVPGAVDDAGGTVTEDGATGSVSGNVLTNDVSGADQPKSFVAWSAGDAAAIAALNMYGTLTQNADGSWSYVLDNSRAATQALGAAFNQSYTLNYTMQDADGDQSSAKLVITVKGAADSASVVTAVANGPDATVYEAGLPTGSANDNSDIATGSFTVSATDGIANIVVGGTTFTLAQMQNFATVNGVVDTGEGTLRLTGYTAATGVVSYSYTLKATIDNDSKPGATLTSFDDSVSITVNGIGGTTGSDTLVVRIVDDVPGAVDDAGGTVTEDGATGSVSGNVLANDVSGADQPKSFVAWSAGDAAAIAALNMYGTLTQNADGSWSYVLDNSRAATQALGAAFNQSYTLNYTMQDADGDQSSAKLVITVKGAADSASVVTAVANGPDATVYEAGLPTGSANDNSDIATGSFTVSATDGIANIVVGGTTFTLAQMQNFATVNGVVDTGEGTLRLTGYTAATGVVSYSYTLKATIDNDSKPGATLTSFDDSVSITVNGIGGTTGSDTLVVRIVDDVPTLGVVQSQQTDNNVATPPAVGTLHYVAGADGTASMVITANTSSITVGGQAVATVQNGNVLTAYVDVDNSGGFNAGDTTVFTLTVNPTAGPSGQYVFDLVTKLDPTVTDVPIGSGSAFGSGPSNEVVVTDNATLQQLVYVTGWAPTGGFTPAEIATWQAGGLVTATQTSNVNGSTQGWGLGNNNFDQGEFLRFDFGALNDYDGAGGYTPPGTYNIVNASYATFSFFNFNVNEQIIFVAHFTNGTSQSYVINGPDADNIQKISAPAGTLIDWIDVYQSSGEIKLNLTNVGVASSSIDKTIPFTLQFTDNDTDQTTTQNFTVQVKDGLQPVAPAAPIALDLDNDGLEFVGLAAGVTHDYGNGLVNTAWVSSDDGLLARATGGSYDIVFADDAVGAKSDLEGLRLAYDSNGDGVFDAGDAAFGEFGVWQDLNSNGLVDAGEFKSLTAAGIASINLTSDGQIYGAAGGDVTVLGETTFVRTDGSNGTVGDVIFATTKAGDPAKAADTTTSGYNQALVAASLVAVAGAVETVEQEAAPTVIESEATAMTVAPAAPSSASEPTTDMDADGATVAPADDQAVSETDQPVDQSSHGGEEQAPQDAHLADASDASAPVDTDPSASTQPDLGAHQGLLAQSIDLPPVFDGSGAALVAAHADGPAGPTVAQAVSEALGAHDAPQIDALLAALPGGDHAPVPMLLNPVAVDAADTGHFAAAAAAVFDAAMVAHEAMAVAHG